MNEAQIVFLFIIFIYFCKDKIDFFIYEYANKLLFLNIII